MFSYSNIQYRPRIDITLLSQDEPTNIYNGTCPVLIN